MYTPLLNLYTKLEQQRRSLLMSLNSHDHEKLSQSPAPNRWSVIQILVHLLTSERLALQYMKKKVQAIESLPDSGWKESLKMIAFRISQRLPLRFKAPAMIIPVSENISLSEITQQWGEIRKEYEQFLESIEPGHARRLIYKHPFVGRFNVGQAMEILYEHIGHHKPQISRLVKR